MMNKKNNKIRFDVMLNDMFVCTLNMPTLMDDDVIDGVPVFKMETIARSIEKHRPSLRNKPFRIAF